MTTDQTITVTVKPEIDREAVEEAAQLAAALFLSSFAVAVLDGITAAEPPEEVLARVKAETLEKAAQEAGKWDDMIHVPQDGPYGPEGDETTILTPMMWDAATRRRNRPRSDVQPSEAQDAREGHPGGRVATAISALTCDNVDAAPRWWNTEGPLTRSTDYGREGLEVNSTHNIPCEDHRGNEKDYQNAAADALVGLGHEVAHWAWITPRCGNGRCLEPSHLSVHAPMRLAYPHYICIYCGRTGQQRDHLLPRQWSGDVKRHYVVTVPSCGTCNNTLNDTLTWSITERRAICHERLRRKYRKVLKTPDRTEAELAEFGPMLRSYIEEETEKKKAVVAMLAWPTDPHYDLRALEKSGIDNPYAIGLILPDHIDIAEYVRNVA